MLPAPPHDRFPAYPASWYRFCGSRELGRRPLSRDLLGRRLVAFRTTAGKVAVLDARCSHLGADLGGGRVAGDVIQCPFHGWEYGPDGLCTRIPASPEVPHFARQACYPAAERHGSVFFFNGRTPLFPLPFFIGARPEDFTAGRPFRFLAPCSWYMVAAHAFDTQHFASVHDRRLLAPPAIDCPEPFARRNRYTAVVEGRSVFDRLLHVFAGPTVDISITTWAGTFFLLTGAFRRACSYFLITSRPLDEDMTLVEGIVFSRRGANPLSRALFQPPGLWVRRLFTRGYLVDEAARLGSPRYHPGALIDTDRDMVDYFRWVASLPQDEHRPREPEPPAPCPTGCAGQSTNGR